MINITQCESKLVTLLCEEDNLVKSIGSVPDRLAEEHCYNMVNNGNSLFADEVILKP